MTSEEAKKQFETIEITEIFQEDDEEAQNLEIQACEEQQPCEDYISREAALLALTGMDLPTDRDKLIALFTDRIQHLPPVTPQRPKGKWIEIEIDAGEFIYKCTECGMRVINPYKYCPICGADMSGGGEDE